MSWTSLETSTYQDHVIKHVLGATVLGWVVVGDALHMVLDVGLLWTIYVSAEMNLMALMVSIRDLESAELSRAEVIELESDAQLLISEGRAASGLVRFSAAPVECTVIAVNVFASGSQRRIAIEGEKANLEIVTSVETGDLSIEVIQPAI